MQALFQQRQKIHRDRDENGYRSVTLTLDYSPGPDRQQSPGLTGGH
jgi:hypothetical protein